MKKILVFASLFCATFAAYSQSNKEKKDSLMKTMSRDLCVEISKNKETLKGDDFEMSLGMIMMSTIADKATELQDVFNINLADQDAMGKFSEELGMNLAIECPDFLRLIAEKNGFNEATAGSSRKTNTLTGTLEKVVPGDLTYFQVRADNGKSEKIYWMEYFEGANLLTEKMKSGTKVSVQYRETEIYNAATKDYKAIKIASGLSLE